MWNATCLRNFKLDTLCALKGRFKDPFAKENKMDFRMGLLPKLSLMAPHLKGGGLISDWLILEIVMGVF